MIGDDHGAQVAKLKASIDAMVAPFTRLVLVPPDLLAKLEAIVADIAAGMPAKPGRAPYRASRLAAAPKAGTPRYTAPERRPRARRPHGQGQGCR